MRALFLTSLLALFLVLALPGGIPEHEDLPAPEIEAGAIASAAVTSIGWAEPEHSRTAAPRNVERGSREGRPLRVYLGGLLGKDLQGLERAALLMAELHVLTRAELETPAWTERKGLATRGRDRHRIARILENAPLYFEFPIRKEHCQLALCFEDRVVSECILLPDTETETIRWRYRLHPGSRGSLRFRLCEEESGAPIPLGRVRLRGPGTNRRLLADESGFLHTPRFAGR